MTGFNASTVYFSFSIDDVQAARAFYGDTLGMDVEINEMGFLIIKLENGGGIMAYTKPDHTPAGFTVLNFQVEDVDAAVDDLNSRGVVTKIYSDDDFPTDEKGIARGGPVGVENAPDIAWFTDPAGNVLAVLSGS